MKLSVFLWQNQIQRKLSMEQCCKMPCALCLSVTLEIVLQVKEAFTVTVKLNETFWLGLAASNTMCLVPWCTISFLLGNHYPRVYGQVYFIWDSIGQVPCHALFVLAGMYHCTTLPDIIVHTK